MVNESPDARPRRRLRPTRRGKVVLAAVALLVVSAAVLIPLSLTGSDEGGHEKESPHSTLMIPEGRRASQVYEAVDRALDLKPGSTRKAATTVDLALPAQAEGNPEGYLFPATYPIDAATEPAGLLRYMADTARKHFGADHVTAGAQRNNVSVYDTITIASIVQAEADTASDMGKVARVVYNRLLKDMPLQMDSTINYALKRSTLDTTTAETQLDSPYNSYRIKGLP
ncbi:endolytic transglycosylase MltG, partial [Streptomyces anulatus]|uniref:endolytic transglycosylase MltG n=2 Tax=Streptomyces TaxID=1883 RepID=UPI003655F3D8